MDTGYFRQAPKHACVALRVGCACCLWGVGVRFFCNTHHSVLPAGQGAPVQAGRPTAGCSQTLLPCLSHLSLLPLISLISLVSLKHAHAHARAPQCRLVADKDHTFMGPYEKKGIGECWAVRCSGVAADAGRSPGQPAEPCDEFQRSEDARQGAPLAPAPPRGLNPLPGACRVPQARRPRAAAPSAHHLSLKTSAAIPCCQLPAPTPLVSHSLRRDHCLGVGPNWAWLRPMLCSRRAFTHTDQTPPHPQAPPLPSGATRT